MNIEKYLAEDGYYHYIYKITFSNTQQYYYGQHSVLSSQGVSGVDELRRGGCPKAGRALQNGLASRWKRAIDRLIDYQNDIL